MEEENRIIQSAMMIYYLLLNKKRILQKNIDLFSNKLWGNFIWISQERSRKRSYFEKAIKGGLMKKDKKML